MSTGYTNVLDACHVAATYTTHYTQQLDGKKDGEPEWMGEVLR